MMFRSETRTSADEEMKRSSKHTPTHTHERTHAHHYSCTHACSHARFSRQTNVTKGRLCDDRKTQHCPLQEVAKEHIDPPNLCLCLPNSGTHSSFQTLLSRRCCTVARLRRFRPCLLKLKAPGFLPVSFVSLRCWIDHISRFARC